MDCSRAFACTNNDSACTSAAAESAAPLEEQEQARCSNCATAPTERDQNKTPCSACDLNRPLGRCGGCCLCATANAMSAVFELRQQHQHLQREVRNANVSRGASSPTVLNWAPPSPGEHGRASHPHPRPAAAAPLFGCLFIKPCSRPNSPRLKDRTRPKEAFERTGHYHTSQPDFDGF